MGHRGRATKLCVLAFSPFVGNPGPWSTCQRSGEAPAGGQSYNLQYALGAPFAIDVPVCSYYSPIAAGAVAFPQYTADRENVVNVHFGIPHHRDGGKDDVQVLFRQLWLPVAIFRLDKRKRRSSRRERRQRILLPERRHRASSRVLSVLPVIRFRADPTTISARFNATS